MASHFLLFDRPLVMDERAASLQVVGSLPDYEAGDPFEGRLDILNAIGKCSVEIIESTLPAGHTVRVDNVLKQVVVKWPGYDEEPPVAHPFPNGGFEDGDDGTWGKGPGWSIGSGSDYDKHSGSFSARFYGYKGTSVMIGPTVPAKPTDGIRLSCWVQQGASSKGNAGGGIQLLRFDAAGKLLRIDAAPNIMSGRKGRWAETSVYSPPLAGTVAVQAQVLGVRHRENKALWVDDVKWDHKYATGTNDPEAQFYLHIRVRDSANRTADWRGVIEFFAKRFTTLLPVQFMSDIFGGTVALTEHETRDGILDDNQVALFSGTVALTGLATTAPAGPVEAEELIDANVQLVSFETREDVTPAAVVDTSVATVVLSELVVYTNPVAIASESISGTVALTQLETS